ncbi:ATP-dependent DNA ligase [Solirubrobacter sp. CPCC 204708]|uniref:DNA ligase n=1 Tax=Solirubrobacter deserti TaxID=2282478 RepID=A0ABT4RGN4_9ACTN|nr:ATP-dependent DNA ligase [Solirubrobacter deserti]MBE2315474.1 ATP-dependent DNA ligase [Solirubrobacter deserti]MDA0137684.1 ATP-dependent DNA ligase [Solirubrobacter deserti]
MLFAELAAATEDVRAESGRLAKAERIAAALRGLAPDERAAGASYLAGSPRQRVLGVGWASLKEDPPAPAAEASLTVAEVDAALERVASLSGAGSVAGRRAALGELMARATASEQAFLRALVLGDIRQGALAAVVGDAVAKAAEVPVKDVRRALMLRGDLGAVAAVALAGEDLGQFRLEVGRPISPMLASTAPDVDAALEKTGPAAVEWKLDGARIQVHRDGDKVRIFTRTLDDVTARIPEVVEAALALDARSFVLDGEAIALRENGRPHPFQVTGSRFASKSGTVLLTPLFFDVMHLDGVDLLDEPASVRVSALHALVPERWRVPRGGPEQLELALAQGHEGVVVKALEAPYEAGRRGSAWVKVKPVHTLDLVVLAVEWGSGRRRGKLSNLWLGARHEDGFVMLGKTFKGLTDAMLAWQTEKLLELETRREGHVVHVRPELVVEIAFDGVQTSPRYPGGVALRFARVLRHRPDKPAAQADTLEAVLAVRSA